MAAARPTPVTHTPKKDAALTARPENSNSSNLHTPLVRILHPSILETFLEIYKTFNNFNIFSGCTSFTCISARRISSVKTTNYRTRKTKIT